MTSHDLKAKLDIQRQNLIAEEKRRDALRSELGATETRCVMYDGAIQFATALLIEFEASEKAAAEKSAKKGK